MSPTHEGGLETQGGADVAVEVHRLSTVEFPLAQGKSVFCSIQAYS